MAAFRNILSGLLILASFQALASGIYLENEKVAGQNQYYQSSITHVGSKRQLDVGVLAGGWLIKYRFLMSNLADATALQQVLQSRSMGWVVCQNAALVDQGGNQVHQGPIDLGSLKMGDDGASILTIVCGDFSITNH